MKKTQSLKLMLLGLMALGSTNALARQGDVFYDTQKLLFFEELANNEARVVGITGTDGTIVIPDQCANPYDIVSGAAKTLYVTEVSNNWFKQTSVVIKYHDNNGELVESPMQAFDLTAYPGLIDLKVDASKLKKINALALIPINNKIKGFEVTANAGLEEIDDFSFANPGDVATLNEGAVQQYIEDMLKAKEDAQKTIDQKDYEIGRQPAIVNGKYNGKLDWADFNGDDVYVLKRFVNASNVWQDSECAYILVGDEIPNTIDKYGFRQHELWKIDLTNGKLEKLTRTTARYRVDNDGKPTGELVYCNADGTQLEMGVAFLLTKENACDGVEAETLTSTPATAVPGLQDQRTITANNYTKMLQAKNAFEAIIANPNGTTIADLVYKALNTAETAKDEALALYNQAYGPVEGSPMTVFEAWENNLAGTTVTGAVASGDITAATDYATVKDNLYGTTATNKGKLTLAEFQTCKNIIATMALAGYNPTETGTTKYERPYFQEIKENKTRTEEKFNFLNNLKDDLIAYNNDKQGYKNDGITKNTQIVAGGDYGYQHNTSDVAGLTYQQLLAALPIAEQAAIDAREALIDALADKSDAEATKNNLANKDANTFEQEAKANPENYSHSYTAGENTVLKTVKIEPAKVLATIGESAFQNCKEAVFDGTSKLPVASKTIEKNAFNGAAKFAPDFTTLVNLESIGDEAFAYTATTDGDFSGAKKLATVGKDIFLDCAIENLMLLGTPLKEIPEGLAQCLKHENYPFMDACGFFYNFDNKDNKLTDHELNAFEAEMLAPYLLKKEYTAADVAALVGTKLSQQQVDIITAAGLVKGELKVNTSLTVASLPAAITKIQQVNGYTRENGFVGTFERCINLATLTGGIPTGVKEIGNKAFYGTKITSFDLSALSDLYFIGAGAFAGNAELTTVTLPTAAAYGNGGLTELPAGVFECDGDLETVVINPEMQCLPEGLFAGSKIETLDLSNTQVTVIPDLFKATDTKPNTTLKYVILPDTKYKEDNYTMEIPGIRVIGDNAFAHMHALIGSDKTITTAAGNKFIVPTSVELMGTAVFQDDQVLEEVEFTKYSKLTKLGVNTFNSTPKLKKVTFLTANCIDKDFEQINLLGTVTIKDLTGCADLENIIDFSKTFGFGDTQIFASTGRKDKPVVIVTAESKAALVTDYYGQGYQQGYTILNAELPTIAVKGSYPDENGNPMWATTYFNENFGTWVPVEKDKQNGANVTVWTAYQDYDVIYAYPAKHNNKYYKIPAAGYLKKHDLVNGYDPFRLVSNASGARFLEDPQPSGDINLDEIKDAIEHMKVSDLLDLLTDEQKEALLNEFTADEIAEMIENLKESDLEDLFEALLESEASYADIVEAILAEILPTTKFSMFAAQTLKGTYICGPTVKYNPGSAAVIITSDKDKPVNVELYSTADFKYQSTLDWKNELKVSGKPLSTTTDNDVYKFSADTDGWGFFKQVAEIPQGKVIFPMSGYQGTAYPDFKDPKSISVPMPSRVDIVFLSGEFTSIDDVKQYVKAMKESGDIYNMRGMKVTAPVKGQMYIQNGKKFIQK